MDISINKHLEEVVRVVMLLRFGNFELFIHFKGTVTKHLSSPGDIQSFHLLETILSVVRLDRSVIFLETFNL